MSQPNLQFDNPDLSIAHRHPYTAPMLPVRLPNETNFPLDRFAEPVTLLDNTGSSFRLDVLMTLVAQRQAERAAEIKMLERVVAGLRNLDNKQPILAERPTLDITADLNRLIQDGSLQGYFESLIDRQPLLPPSQADQQPGETAQQPSNSLTGKTEVLPTIAPFLPEDPESKIPPGLNGKGEVIEGFVVKAQEQPKPELKDKTRAALPTPVWRPARHHTKERSPLFTPRARTIGWVTLSLAMLAGIANHATDGAVINKITHVWDGINGR